MANTMTIVYCPRIGHNSRLRGRQSSSWQMSHYRIYRCCKWRKRITIRHRSPKLSFTNQRIQIKNRPQNWSLKRFELLCRELCLFIFLFLHLFIFHLVFFFQIWLMYSGIRKRNCHLKFSCVMYSLYIFIYIHTKFSLKQRNVCLFCVSFV